MFAITLSSIAIGVGSEMISIVVRVGFGLPAPVKMFGDQICHSREILFHVGQEDRDINDVVPTRARVLQNEPDIFEDRPALQFRLC